MELPFAFLFRRFPFEKLQFSPIRMNSKALFFKKNAPSSASPRGSGTAPSPPSPPTRRFLALLLFTRRFDSIFCLICKGCDDSCVTASKIHDLAGFSPPPPDHSERTGARLFNPKNNGTLRFEGRASHTGTGPWKRVTPSNPPPPLAGALSCQIRASEHKSRRR